jgi:hypothetical protein
MVNGTGEAVGDADEDALMVDVEEKNGDEMVAGEDTVKQEENDENRGEDEDADGEAEDE